MSAEEIKQNILGAWSSIAVEVRPSISKNADGSAKPFYLTRQFTYQPDDKFQLEIINWADALGKVPLVKMNIKGHIEWMGDHPVAVGAQKVNFIADEAYDVTPMVQGFVDILNKVATNGFNIWEVDQTQSILRKAFVPFGLAEGQVFMEYDLIYLLNDMMFWGARHVDGRGFDTEENRPVNLQIPMQRL